MTLFESSRNAYRFTETGPPLRDVSFLDEYKLEPLVSLETALQNLSSHVRSLNKYIKSAQESCNKSGRYGLTIDESAAIYLYTIEWDEGSSASLYSILNASLHSAVYSRIKVWFPYMKLFATGLNKLPSVRSELWRNVQGNVIHDYRINKLFRWANVISCSSNIDQVFRSFWNIDGPNTLFKIRAMNGKSIADYSRYGSEEEVIILPGTRFCVTGDYISKNAFTGDHIVITQLLEI